jgi:hypothetical protein
MHFTGFSLRSRFGQVKNLRIAATAAAKKSYATRLLAIGCLGLSAITSIARADSFTDVTLGQAGNLSVFVTGGTFQSTNPITTTNGNVGFAAGVTQSGTSDGKVTGVVYYQNASSLTGIGNFNSGGTFTQTSLAQAVIDAQNASTNAAALAATQAGLGAVTNSTIINATGVENVVDAASINLSNGTLTINGAANDYFIINVSGNINITNGGIQATGGIAANHILFNLDGSNASLTTQTSTSEVGTFLAPFADDTITTHGNPIDGALIGYNVSMTSGTDLTGSPFTPGTPVPLPNVVLAVPVLVGVFSAYQLRRRIARAVV